MGSSARQDVAEAQPKFGNGAYQLTTHGSAGITQHTEASLDALFLHANDFRRGKTVEE